MLNLANILSGGQSVSSAQTNLPGGGSITGSGGAITIAAGPTNNNVTIAPAGTGTVTIPVGGATGYPVSPFLGQRVVSEGGIESGYLIDAYGLGATNRFVGRGAGGTAASPTATPNGMVLANFSARGYDGSAFSGTAGGYSVSSRNAWDTGTPNRGTSLAMFYIPLNTTATRNAIQVNSSSRGVVLIGDASGTVDQPDQAGFGVQFCAGPATTYRNTTAATGTNAEIAVNSFHVSTLSATNTGVVYTNSATVKITGEPTAGTNVTLTNSYGLWNVGKTRLDGTTNVSAATATPAGGATAAVLLFGTTSGFGIYYGSGAPTVSAAKGSLYLRSDGTTTNDRMFVNTNGSTTWTACTTVA